MDLIASLDDPARFVRKDRVAVFKPHRRTFPNGFEVVVTEADLGEIADNVNRNYGADGQLVKLTIGHRKQAPDFPETNQPPVVGYARNYRAEWVDRPDGPSLRLTHTECIRTNSPYTAGVLAGQYPERSPEYDPAAKVITGVALLTRDQALGMGIVCYQAVTAEKPNVTPTHHTAPADHEKVLAYMRAMPGLSYEAAQAAVNDPAKRAAGTSPTPDAVVAYLRQHPGMSYEKAESLLAYSPRPTTPRRPRPDGLPGCSAAWRTWRPAAVRPGISCPPASDAADNQATASPPQ
jgi:hypothetical protein